LHKPFNTAHSQPQICSQRLLTSFYWHVGHDNNHGLLHVYTNLQKQNFTELPSTRYNTFSKRKGSSVV